jgi:hypothetical protein
MSTHATPEEDQLARLHSMADDASHQPHPLDAIAEAARHQMLYGTETDTATPRPSHEELPA